MGKKSKKGQDASETAKDSRMSTIKSDPVFREMPKREKKVKVDPRFKAMFDDEQFSSTTASVDRHGRPINKLKSREDLRNIYEMEEEESEQGGVDGETKDRHSRTKKKVKRPDFARGEGGMESSSEEEESEAESVDEEEQDALAIHDKWGELDRTARRVEWTSARLAVCNMDWDRMTAEDIFVALESFKPEGGKIKSVHVYLSDFGAEQLNHEEKHGPRLSIQDDKNKVTREKDDSDGDEAEDAKPEAIRAYQFDRYRYYYAIVACDSENTANGIYESCDGIQYQSSGLALDLRFVPDDMEFDSSRLRDQCLPDTVNLRKYKPNNFESDTLRSTVKLNWDGDDFHRKKKVQKAFDDNADLEDLSALVASGSEDEATNNRESANLLLSAASVSVYSKKGHLFDEEMDKEDDTTKPQKTKKPRLKTRLVEKKKRKMAEAASHLPADPSDSRFSALYTSSDFAIDKTNPHYKGGVLADLQVQEKIRRKK